MLLGIKMNWFSKLPIILMMVFFLFFGSKEVKSQMLEPVKWELSTANTENDGEYILIFKAKIDDGWKVYANDISDGVPIKTDILFDTLVGFELVGGVQQLGRVEGPEYEPLFEKDLKWFKKKAVFRQTIKILDPSATIKGYLEYMTCDATQCLAPTEVPFEYSLKGGSFQSTGISINENGEEVGENQEKGSSGIEFNYDWPNKFEEKGVNQNLWGFLIAGILSGLLALLTPCVFPMIPLTVSFFTKSSSTRAKGLSNALIYALSIIIIFLSLGFAITMIFGPDKLNEMASNNYFNLIFFVVFIFFALSFFGVFELTLPSKLVNKTDSMSDKGGLIGIFFMAFTLVLVSFSCTAPIVGTLLVLIADSGAFWAPLMGLLGFSLALAIPFALFAAFPGWLNSLPKSGGWLNTVKVSLGFVEVALAFKFLSVADLAYHWNFLTRDIFLALWIIIALLWGMYLIGKLRFANDPEIGHVSVTRLFFGIMAFAFGIYMVPGLWGAPVKLLSGIAPPQHYQEFSLGPTQFKIIQIEKSIAEISEHLNPTEKINENKFADLIPKSVLNVGECPHELPCEFDLQRGMIEARHQNKPLLVDFTGWSCVNCRKMEDNVWSNPKVWEIINEKYILISLYVDDKNSLPEQYWKSSYTNKEVKSIGKLWSNLQREWFNINSQPYYVLMGHDYTPLVWPQGYTPSVDDYVEYLENGVTAFEENQLASK